MAGLSRFGITPDADEAVGQQAGKGDMLAHPDDNVVVHRRHQHHVSVCQHHSGRPGAYRP